MKIEKANELNTILDGLDDGSLSNREISLFGELIRAYIKLYDESRTLSNALAMTCADLLGHKYEIDEDFKVGFKDEDTANEVYNLGVVYLEKLGVIFKEDI